MRISEFNSDNNKNSSAIILIVVLLLTFWFYTKIDTTRETVLMLEITEHEELILEGNSISFHDFHSSVNQLITQLESQGISKDKVVVALYPDRKLNMGIIADVQQQLRKCDLRKISYNQ